ncbi:MAG: hypothetical protein LV468_04855 [Candidatus Nitrosotenuis sp.]|nr:hypothetical protein [Candidatus Nitrosotenuis sp.]
MKNLNLSIALAASFVLMSAVFIGGQLQTADAAKASGKNTQQFGKYAETSICGDQPCNAQPSKPYSMESKNAPTSADLKVLLQKMDLVQKRHQSDLKERWSSLSHSEKIQVYQKLENMLQKMDSMDMVEHINKMVDGKSHDGGYGKDMSKEDKGDMKGHKDKGDMKQHGKK